MRFSLSALLVVVTVLCGYVGLLMSAPHVVSLLLLSLSTLVFAGFLAGGYFATTGATRAFLLGCLVGMLPASVLASFGFAFAWYAIGDRFDWSPTDRDLPLLKWMVVASHAIVCVCGMLSLLAWHVFHHRETRHQQARAAANI